MIDELKILKQLRKFSEDLNKKKKQTYDDYLETNKELFENISVLNDEINKISEEIREAAIIKYQLTGVKQLTGGVGIRVLKKLEYEVEEALEWAISHKLCLALNKPAFNKIAKTEQIDFVSIKEKITATIPTNIKI